MDVVGGFVLADGKPGELAVQIYEPAVGGDHQVPDQAR